MTTVGSFTLGAGWARDGEHAEIHVATDPNLRPVVLKIAHGPDEDDLLANEAMTLRAIRTSGIHDNFMPYVPEILTTFTEGDQRVNVFSYLDGFVSLADVMVAYPDGIDLLDAAWMWRRILVALGYVHANGYVHAGVTPDHVLIHPTEHGVILIDWSYAVPEGESLMARSPAYRHWYPDPGLSPSPAMDVLMACRTIAAVMGAGEDLAWPGFPPAPATIAGDRMWAHLRGCMQAGAPGAWDLKEDFDELLERLYGPRKYRPFTMPS